MTTFASDENAIHVPVNPVRFVTATSLFDGHDASINIMRRILQSQGAEVIHLGHNRSVDEVVTAVIHEDVQGVAISSYQGGHVEYFRYLVERLRDEGLGHVKVYGGGGGVIVPADIEEMYASGVTKIFTPEDGAELGLARMINQLVEECDVDPVGEPTTSLDPLTSGSPRALAHIITELEAGALDPDLLAELRSRAAQRPVPVLGITGTGGSGKSSLTDELIRRFRLDFQDKLRVAVIAVDPTRRRGGGALLGDRIRMNALDSPSVFFRSLATRGSSEVPECLDDAIAACKTSGVDLVVVETPGIGQGDAAIIDHCDLSLYVMTPEFGAASQLEKIDMLDLADIIAINKYDRRGGADALRDVRRQVVRNREAFHSQPEDMAVYGTVAARVNDDGVTALYGEIATQLEGLGLEGHDRSLTLVDPARAAESGKAARAAESGKVDAKVSTSDSVLITPGRSHYLLEVAETVRDHHTTTDRWVREVRLARSLRTSADHLETSGLTNADAALAVTAAEAGRLEDALPVEARSLLADWRVRAAELAGDELVATDAKGRSRSTPLVRRSLADLPIRRVALPRFDDDGDLLRWLRNENLPGYFPFTAGVFPFKRDDEDPTRMFAGEGDPFRTNRRFHLLAEDTPATRLSTAFDSVTLYGFDPAEQPDIYGKVGNAGVSIATIDDVAVLYDGFDLCAPSTSVSMTINGPAPSILAMYLNVAIDDHIARFAAREGRDATVAERADLRAEALRTVRGTVQADILKEDQGQNTCIFSTDFALGMMSDIQEWFVANEVRNFYSVSISGYHIAEAGANPISQLAFTLANAFTYVEAYLARGMDIDDFAPNLSFFFSNGMDPEYAVLGRVARRIWAVAMRDRYGANERSQKLKYHIQTSGRSLHAQEIQFNDIRTTLQALIAIYDNCNSLHTNAYDEAITTPTEESVRRAMAIQLIINREWGVAMNENPIQGSFITEELTELVEEAVLAEFERIDERGGVLGAMETGYQRGRIQDESMLYEQRKHDGSLPLIGVNTFRSPADPVPTDVELMRSTTEEKDRQLERLRDFQSRHAAESPSALERLRTTALEGGNLFEVLMDTVRVASLGEITQTLFEVGGRYRRNV